MTKNLCRKGSRFVNLCNNYGQIIVWSIYFARGDNLAYYLIITFIIFVFIDYKYIYSYVDSKFLYTTSGSKLNKEVNKEKNKNIFCHYDRLDLIIFVSIFLILFSLNYMISSIAFNNNPLTVTIIKQINIRDLIQGYESNIKIIYNLSAAICILLITNKNKDILKKYILKLLYKKIGREQIQKEGKEGRLYSS